MHVISGRFKGVALTTPKTGTRPTTDRTKEAIFSHLDSWQVLDDARVLDLFAGTGALGIEALSRGARGLVAVESSAPAAALIAKTLTALQRNRSWERGMTARVIRPEPRSTSLRVPHARPRTPMLLALREVGGVRCDLHRPPYAFATEDCNQLLSDMVAHGIAGGNTTIVLERSARSDEPVPPEGWVLAEHRDYGETAVWYIESALETSEASETSGATDE